MATISEKYECIFQTQDKVVSSLACLRPNFTDLARNVLLVCQQGGLKLSDSLDGMTWEFVILHNQPNDDYALLCLEYSLNHPRIIAALPLNGNFVFSLSFGSVIFSIAVRDHGIVCTAQALAHEELNSFNDTASKILKNRHDIFGSHNWLLR